jgi:predicted enzyme related to lactoylglutathione lyase
MFETDDLEYEMLEWHAKGMKLPKIETTPWGKFVRLADPDGNGISLHQK